MLSITAFNDEGVTQTHSICALQLLLFGLSSYIINQCGKKPKSIKETPGGHARAGKDQKGANSQSIQVNPKEELKNDEADKKEDKDKHGEQAHDSKKGDVKDGEKKVANSNDEKKSDDEKNAHEKAEKEEDGKKDDKKKTELKPKQIKRNEKEERIAQGKEVRNKGDYPTFNDVESDWDSEKDKKKADEKAKSAPKINNDKDDMGDYALQPTQPLA